MISTVLFRLQFSNLKILLKYHIVNLEAIYFMYILSLTSNSVTHNLNNKKQTLRILFIDIITTTAPIHHPLKCFGSHRREGLGFIALVHRGSHSPQDLFLLDLEQWPMEIFYLYLQVPNSATFCNTTIILYRFSIFLCRFGIFYNDFRRTFGVCAQRIGFIEGFGGVGWKGGYKYFEIFLLNPYSEVRRRNPYPSRTRR